MRFRDKHTFKFLSFQHKLLFHYSIFASSLLLIFFFFHYIFYSTSKLFMITPNLILEKSLIMGVYPNTCESLGCGCSSTQLFSFQSWILSAIPCYLPYHFQNHMPQTILWLIIEKEDEKDTHISHALYNITLIYVN